MPCRGDKSVEVKDSLSTQPKEPSNSNNQKGKNAGNSSTDLKTQGKKAVVSTSENKENINNNNSNLCGGKKSVEVKDSISQKPSGSKGDVRPTTTNNESVQNAGNGTNVSPVKSWPCRGSKNVEVKDSTSQQRPTADDGKSATVNVQKDSQKPAEIKDAPAKKSGLCRGSKSVEVKDSISKPTAPEGNAKPNNNSDKQNGENVQNEGKRRSLPGKGGEDPNRKTSVVSGNPVKEETQKEDAKHISSENRAQGGRPRLCCVGSSVQVRDSLRPVPKPAREEGIEELKAQAQEDYNEEEEISDEEKSEDGPEDRKEEEEEEEDEEIYLGSMPPPPKLKKKKGKKKRKARIGLD